MSAPREETIRDGLADKLDLLETGLTTISTEEHLPNVHGAQGFVDILARDVYGNLVLIELKRSDSAARAAIHELFKYTALVRQNYGLPTDRIRCIVVSTTWHELLVPFSEFARAAEFPVIGFHLTVDEDGTPIKVEAVRPSDTESAVVLAPVHWIGCHATREARESTHTKIVNLFDEIGLHEYVILFVEHDRTNHRIIHPFVCYVVLGRIPLELAESLCKRNVLGIGDYCGGEDVSDSEWRVEEAVFSALYRAQSADSVEGGWPEKLLGMLNSLWTVTSIHRHGKLSSEHIYPHDALIRLCAQTESRNAILFSTIVRPEFKTRWRKAVEDLTYTLEGNNIWKTGTLRYLSEIAQNYPGASVAVHVYNPMNLLLHLYLATKELEPRYLPELNIVIESGRDEVRFLLGRLSWNGRRPPPPEVIVKDVFGGVSEFLLSQSIHTYWEHEEEVARHYGLSYNLLEVIRRADVPPECRKFVLDEDDGTWSAVDKPDDSFDKFMRQGEHLRELAEWLSRCTNL